MRKKQAAAVLLSAALSVSSIPIYASPITMPDGTIFDPEYYAATYPDVVAVFGTKTSALYNHYKTYGKKEGRYAADPAMFSQIQQDAYIKAAIQAFSGIYYEGLPWTNEDNCYYNPVWHVTGYGCVAFAMTISDNVYGAKTKVNVLSNASPSDIRVGDVVKYLYDGINPHWVVVMEVSDTTITVCEGNYNKKVHWGRVIQKSTMEGRIVKITRRG